MAQFWTKKNKFYLPTKILFTILYGKGKDI